MDVKWTREQQEVIDSRNRNLLVSAAAGSGKTAVLVERIISKITDKKNPVDIDRLLIMTFTRASAGEMKERISKAVEKALYEDPDNEHLQKQMTLLHTAQITTIDGFCSYVIRNYFHLIGLDPGYRTAEEGELKLLRGDVLKELLEEHYAADQDNFKSFVECYAPSKTDEGLGKLIEKLYDMAMSNPYPQEWLENCLKDNDIETVQKLRETPWMSLLWKAVEDDLNEAELLLKEAKKLCEEPDGPYTYQDAFDSDALFIRELRSLSADRNFNGFFDLLGKTSFASLSTKRTPDVDEQKKKRAKALRDNEKKIIQDLRDKYFTCREEEILEMLKYIRVPTEMLVNLTLEFIIRFGDAKREKNILDFTDMEHFALKILVSKDEDGIHMTQAARELSAKYDEVMVDEYQDTNYVQELITTSVSGWVNERKNIFMVGDVKQSIYRFRLARPELFMEKYKTYSFEESSEQKICLHKNFRSRHQVLDSVNFIFRQIMGEDLGGISYDEDAALYPGAVFPEGEDGDFAKTEVLMVEKDGPEFDEEKENQNARELEALAIAHRIHEMVGKEKIMDRDTKEYRPLEYGDIVILLRTAFGWSETFREVLASQGIPVYCTSRTGYFSAPEIVTVLNYLKVCDNPLQDLPLMGVLRSPIVGCTSEELAEVRIQYPQGLLYDSITAYALNQDENNVCGKKLKTFLSLLNKVRDMAVYTPVHELILFILKETGYGSYARALPGGEQRYANLSMLVEKAMDYEKTSYRGLFNFVRYIEQLQAYEVDYGEVNVAGASGSAVEIMTIHKSKGLEFPVVFVAGMGKQFNFQDINAGLLIHPELGIGTDIILPEKRIIAPFLKKQMIRREILKESLGEELRILYVAMTRAKEKLILTGTVEKMENLMNSLSRFADEKEVLLPLGVRLKAKNYWDFVLPALARHRAMKELFEEYGILTSKTPEFYDDQSEITVRKITAGQMAQQEIILQTENQMQEEELINWDKEKVYDKKAKEEIEKRFSFRYPWDYLKEIPVKVSVSELKKRSWHSEYEQEETVIYDRQDEEPPVPAFIADRQEEYKGAARGTAYHRFMECLDYSQTETDLQLQGQLLKLQEQKKIKEQEAQCIQINDIRSFLNSSLGRRMKKASSEGRLFREQPFVITEEASQINPLWNGEETVLVQGIIDAYFIEEEDIVLVDYKTDHVRRGQEQKLVELYRIQLEDYARALYRLTGKRVKEKIIYSFTLQKEIQI